MKLFFTLLALSLAMTSPLVEAADHLNIGGDSCATAPRVGPTDAFIDSTVGTTEFEDYLKGVVAFNDGSDADLYCCNTPSFATTTIDGSCSSIGNGHWYEVFSGCGGDTFVTISMEICAPNARDYDTFISVYKGDCVDGLECVAANDDTTGCGLGSAITFLQLEEETLYYIFVHGYNGDEGQYRLSLSGALFSGSCKGDPHFKRWNGEYYDFHGEGDFAFLKNPTFRDGLGMDIQIRTTKRYLYSYIESAALRIGDDILEVYGFGGFMLNGISNADLSEVVLGGQFKITHEKESEKKSTFKVHISEESYVELSAFKDLVGVNIVGATNEDFVKSKGMMGTFSSINNRLLSRNGTVMAAEDANAFGQDWQVQPEIDGMLFQTARSPQFPEPVIMPDPDVAEKRRLGESIPKSVAEKACEHVEHDIRFDHCVYDVIASGDLELAQGGVY